MSAIPEQAAASDIRQSVSDEALHLIVKRLDDPHALFALLVEWDMQTIGEIWQAIRGLFGADNDPLPEFTYSLHIEHFREWTRECLATFHALAEVDRVVRVVELTTVGFIRGIDADSAWHAFLMADGLPLEALAYVRGYDHGSNWRELAARVPADAILLRDRAIDPARESALRHLELVRRGVASEPPLEVPARRLGPSAEGGRVDRGLRIEVAESSRDALAGAARIVFDRERGLVHGLGDSVALERFELKRPELRVTAGPIAALGVVIDASFEAERDPPKEAALALYVASLEVQGLRVETSLGLLTAAGATVQGLAMSLREIAGATQEVKTDGGAEAKLAEDGVPADEGPLGPVIDALVAALAVPLAGALTRGPGGSRLVADAITLKGVSFTPARAPSRALGAATITLTRCEARVDRMVLAGRDARADSADFLALYAEQRTAPLEPDALHRFHELQKKLDGALTLDVGNVTVSLATAGEAATTSQPTTRADALSAHAGTLELGRVMLSARSPSWASRQASRASAVVARLVLQSPPIARAVAPIELELALASATLDTCELALASTRLIVDGPSASDIRVNGRASSAPGTSWFTKLQVGAARAQWRSAPSVGSGVESNGALTLTAGRVELLDSGDLRVALGEVASTGANVIVPGRLPDGRPEAPWHTQVPQLEIRRVSGVTLDATLPRLKRVLTFSLGVAQIQLGNLSYPRHPGSPRLEGGAVIGASHARGTLASGPWRLRLDELRVARIEVQALHDVWSRGLSERLEISRGFVEELRLRTADAPALTLRVGRIGLPELELQLTLPSAAGPGERLHATPSVMISNVDVSRGADGRIGLGSGPVVVSGRAELGETWSLPRASLTFDGLRVVAATDRWNAIEAGNATIDTQLVAAGPALRGTLDVRVAVRGPSLTRADGEPRQLTLRFDGGDAKLGASFSEGPWLGSGSVEARGLGLRLEHIARDTAAELIVQSLATPRLELRDVQLRRGTTRVAMPSARIDRLEVTDLGWVGGTPTRGRARGGGVVAERFELAFGSELRLNSVSAQGSELLVEPGSAGWSAGLAELRLTQLVGFVDAGRSEVPAVALAEVGFRQRAGGELFARSATFQLSPAGVTAAGATTRRVTLDFLSDMQGEIGLTVPIVNERITGQLAVEGTEVHLGPTLVASHPLQEQYWGWAPRWLVTRLVVSAARYVADFFERELVQVRARLEARLEGRGDRPRATDIDAGVVARQLVDAMVRWSAAVDVLMPGERGALRLIGDPIDRWLAPPVNDGDAISQREKRMQDIAGWTRGIALVVGVQATGEADVRALDHDSPVASARVGARLVGSGTLGAHFPLALTANLSHVLIRAGGYDLEAAQASLDGIGATPSPAARGTSGKASELVLRRRPDLA